MERPTIDQIMMECAKQFALRSTCARVHCGAVIAVQNHIVSTGYNGTAHGRPHCIDHWHEVHEDHLKKGDLGSGDQTDFFDYLASDLFRAEHHAWSIGNELHAEANAIIYAARKGLAIDGATIYTTHSPCLACGKSIIFSGIKRVFYFHLYDREEGFKSIDLLRENGIEVLES